jgi:hypothetical protein
MTDGPRQMMPILNAASPSGDKMVENGSYILTEVAEGKERRGGYKT